MSTAARASASLLLLLMLPMTWGAGVALAATPTSGTVDDELILHAYAFKHKRASDAIALVHPLLSPRGTLELQPADNTLVIRDSPAAIARIVPLLRSYDRPPRPLKVDIMIVRASRTAVSPPIFHSDLPEELTRRLHDLLGYDNYDVEARGALAAQEGEAVTYELGSEYQVSFRSAVLPERRVRLSDFEIRRLAKRAPRGAAQAQAQVLIRTNMNLWVDRTMSLGLAKSEASREALMVVLTVHDGERRSAP
jgi:Bacterial type II/III secretion system short domain